MTNVLLLIAIVAEVVATTALKMSDGFAPALIGITLIVCGVVMINVVSGSHGV